VTLQCLTRKIITLHPMSRKIQDLVHTLPISVPTSTTFHGQQFFFAAPDSQLQYPQYVSIHMHPHNQLSKPIVLYYKGLRVIEHIPHTKA